MNYRKLGNTGVSVSEIGMGCNRLGEPSQSDSHWTRLVEHAVDLGVNIFDSSESYGWGRSEEMLGRGLAGKKDILVATKISRIQETGAKDFSAARIIERCEGSLGRLGRDCIDIYQLHSPNREELERFDWAEGLQKLLDAGKIRFPAVAVNNAADGIFLIEQGFARVLQLTYNIFETSAGEALFPKALEKGVGLLCRLPLAQGILTGKFKAGQEVAEGHRAHLAGDRMPELIERAEDLRELGSAYDGGMTRMAHHFSLAPQAISAIIPGARTVAQLEDNVAASGDARLTRQAHEGIARIRKQWSR